MTMHFSRSGVGSALAPSAPEQIQTIAGEIGQQPGIDVTQYLAHLGELGLRKATLYDAIQVGAVVVRSPNNLFPANGVPAEA